MLALPTTTITIKRPVQQKDGWEVDQSVTFTVVSTSVPASLIETGQNTQRRASTTPRSIRGVSCRVAGGTDLQGNDTIVDEVAGTIYKVINVRQPQVAVVTGDLVATVERISPSTS